MELPINFKQDKIEKSSIAYEILSIDDIIEFSCPHLLGTIKDEKAIARIEQNLRTLKEKIEELDWNPCAVLLREAPDRWTAEQDKHQYAIAAHLILGKLSNDSQEFQVAGEYLRLACFGTRFLWCNKIAYRDRERFWGRFNWERYRSLAGIERQKYSHTSIYQQKCLNSSVVHYLKGQAWTKASTVIQHRWNRFHVGLALRERESLPQEIFSSIDFS